MKLRYNIAAAFITALALSAVAPFVTGCSDNVEQGLYPDTESHISLSAAPASAEIASGFQNGLLSVGSAQSATIFSVTCTTRWTVEVTNCEGAWCQIAYGDNSTDKEAGQIGDGTFTIDAAPNRTNDKRTCTVTVRAIDAAGNPIPGVSQEIYIQQDSQSIDVQSNVGVISHNGTTEPLVTVTANQAWTVTTSHSWVSVIPGQGMDGNSFTPEAGSTAEQTVSFRISVQPNPGTADRRAEVTISSPSSAFTPQRVNIVQEGSTETFVVTPTAIPVISYNGTVIEFQVYSPHESWSVLPVSVGGWLTAEPTGGEATTQPVTVRVTVLSNQAALAREGSVVFGHGSATLPVSLTQSGNPEVPDPDYTPTVTAPWLESGWTFTDARIYAYFSSPMYEITGCGVRLNSDNETLTFEGSWNDNLISAHIDSLKPETKYKAVAFVTYSIGGNTHEAIGEPMYFTTPDLNGNPGEVPKPDDNTPPSPNGN